MTVDEALREALRADRTGKLREQVTDLAAAAWRISCRPDGEEAEALRRLAEVLRDTVLEDASAADGQSRDQPSRTGEADRAPAIPPWLADARDEILALSGNRLNVAVGDPAELWRHLHLGTLWLTDSHRRQSLEVLRVDPRNPEYLVPPLAEAGDAGITWSAAEAHPAAAKALADWPPELRDAGSLLQPIIGATFTVVDLAPGLFTTSGAAHGEIKPVETSHDRQSFQERVERILTTLAAESLDPHLRVDWLSELDEALRSVFPLPVPSAYSQWAKRLRVSLDVLTAHARNVSPGAEVELVKARTAYEDPARHRFAGGNNVAIRPFQPTELNQVLWPLRAYVELPGSPATARLVRAGRVVYGHSRGFPYPAPANEPR